MTPEELPEDPFALFRGWMTEAEASEPHDANAMALATATATGGPSVRMVLLKDVSEGGFVFYTNIESRKGKELAENAQVSLLFYWKSLRRQIRVEGRASPVSAREADSYFASRPRGAQVGAWASAQSRPLEARAELEGRVTRIEKKFAAIDIPRPPYWSGFRVMPHRMEFWIDRRDRLHERYVYERREGETWHSHMIQP